MQRYVANNVQTIYYITSLTLFKTDFMSILDKLLYKMFGTPHARKVKRLQPALDAISVKLLEYQKLTDRDLAAKSAEFRELISKGQTLEDIKTDAFAVCQEACDRRLGIFNVFDAQHGFDFARRRNRRNGYGRRVSKRTIGRWRSCGDR